MLLRKSYMNEVNRVSEPISSVNVDRYLKMSVEKPKCGRFD